MMFVLCPGSACSLHCSAIQANICLQEHAADIEKTASVCVHNPQIFLKLHLTPLTLFWPSERTWDSAGVGIHPQT